uniref:Uncharacterized protein n=1 Tax=Caenorhabditis japonica TaxID=281687 RepID=A0A8R1HY01_CAEJA
MRRYVLSNARKKHRKRTFEEAGIFYDDDMFEEVYYDDPAEPPSTGRLREQTEAHRIAHMACRFVGRKIENRIITLLDNRLGPQKHQAELLTEWINTLAGTTADDYDIAIHNVVASMRKQLDEIIGADASEYLEEPGTSGKRRHLDVSDSASKQARFEGERFIFEGEEYVEEEVIAEDVVEDVPSTSENGEPRNEVKYDRADGTSFFFTQRGPAPTTTTVVEEDDH